MQQQQYRHAANGRHDIAHGGKLVDDGINTRACAGEESGKHIHLHEQGEQSQYSHEQSVDGTLGDHRTQRFGKRHAIVASQHAAAGELSDARHHQTCRIREKHRMYGRGFARVLSDRFQRLFPSPATEHLCQYAKGKGQQHP